MKRYLELTRIARALKAETWQRGARNGAQDGRNPDGRSAGHAKQSRTAAGLALATTTAGPP